VSTSTGSGSGGGAGAGQGSGLGPGTGGGFGGGVFRIGSGVVSPRLLQSVRPNYTSDAMRAKVQGVVVLEGVVLPDGTVGDVRVTRSLDRAFGLDEEAVKAAKRFRFQPGTRFGEPVAVLVSFEIEFTLR
jgi:TonB family protein